MDRIDLKFFIIPLPVRKESLGIILVFEPPMFIRLPSPCETTILRNQLAKFLLFEVFRISRYLPLDFDLSKSEGF